MWRRDGENPATADGAELMGVLYTDEALEVGQSVESTDGVYGVLIEKDPPTIRREGGGRDYCIGTTKEIKRIFLPGGGVLPWPAPKTCPCPGCRLPFRHGRRLGEMGGDPFHCERCHLRSMSCGECHSAHDGPTDRAFSRDRVCDPRERV